MLRALRAPSGCIARMCRAIPTSPTSAKARDLRHGCFWHGHDCRARRAHAQGQRRYWRAKIARNRARDEANASKLAALGWRSLTVWECEIKDVGVLEKRLREFLLSNTGK